MQLRNKVLKNAHVVYVVLVIGVIGLAALFYNIAMDNAAIRITGIIFIIITALYAIPIFFLDFPTRSFDRYYEKLSKLEKVRFATELESKYNKQKFRISDIVSVRILSSSGKNILYLNGKKGALDAMPETATYSTEQMLQDLLKSNPNIIQK